MSQVVIAIAATAGSLFFNSNTLQAQSAPSHKPGFEFVMSSGSLVPTGAQRDAVKRANMSTAQLSYVVHPSLAITSTIGWARSRDIASVGDPKLDVFTYDVGAEVRAQRMKLSSKMTLLPFAGVGAGARSYNYRSLHVDATHNAAAYGSVGGELGYRRARLRIEARDYVTGFKPLVGAGAADRRNDVAVLIGLRFAAR